MSVKKLTAVLIISILVLGLFAGCNKKLVPASHMPQDKFTTNVKDSNKHVQAIFVLELEDESNLDDVKSKNSKISEAILVILREKNEADLKDENGDIIEILKQDIMKVLEEKLEITYVYDVSVCGLVMQ